MAERRVAKVLIALGLLAAIIMIVVRVQAEQVATHVELVLDLNDVRTMAQAQQAPLDQYLRQMREAGVTSVGVSEATLQNLEDDGYIRLMKGGDLLTLLELGGALGLRPESIQPGLYYAIAPNPAFGGWLADQLERKLPPGAAKLLTAPGQGPAVVQAAVSDDQVQRLGVGILAGDLELVAKAGLSVVPRLENVRDFSGDYINSVLDAAAAGSKTHSPGGAVQTVIFNGPQALGYPTRLQETAAAFSRRGIVLGLVEAPLQLGFIQQLGATDIAQLTDYSAVRVYSIGRPELDKYSAADAVDRQVRAVKERDIRVIYVRPILVKVDQNDKLGANLQYVRDLAAGIRDAGFHIGPAVPFKPVHPNRFLLALMALGIVAGGMLLLQNLIPLSSEVAPVYGTIFWALLIIGALGSAGLLLVSRGNLIRELLALAAALAFPSLAGLWAGGAALRLSRRNPSRGELLLQSAWILVRAVLIALIASFFISAVLGGDSKYLLEIGYFRGVKATDTVPLLLAAWAYVYRYGVRPGENDTEPGSHSLLGEAAYLGKQQIAVWHVALLAVGAVGFYIYLSRSGNTSGLPVTTTEVQARDLIEKLMIIRPRTKEFLVAWPSLMVAIWAAVRRYRNWVPLFLLGGTIGLSSVVNTFEHLRTTFLVSLWRTGNGLLLGIVTGWVAVAVLDLVWPWFEQRWRSAQDA